MNERTNIVASGINASIGIEEQSSSGWEIPYVRFIQTMIVSLRRILISRPGDTFHLRRVVIHSREYSSLHGEYSFHSRNIISPPGGKSFTQESSHFTSRRDSFTSRRVVIYLQESSQFTRRVPPEGAHSRIILTPQVILSPRRVIISPPGEYSIPPGRLISPQAIFISPQESTHFTSGEYSF